MMTGKRRRAQLVEDAKAGELHGFAAGVACGVCGDRVQAVMAPSWAAARDGHGVCDGCLLEACREQVATLLEEQQSDAASVVIAPPVAEAIASVAPDHGTLSEEEPRPLESPETKPKRKRRGEAGKVPEEA